VLYHKKPAGRALMVKRQHPLVLRENLAFSNLADRIDVGKKFSFEHAHGQGIVLLILRWSGHIPGCIPLYIGSGILIADFLTTPDLNPV